MVTFIIYFICVLTQNKLYNKNVKVEYGQVIQFNIGGITIQENINYKEVRNTITRLNQNITIDKYIYCGQPLQRIAHEYFERNFDKNYMSQMSPEIANVFDNALSKNTAFNLTLQNVQATHAYDFNKLYSTILREWDRHGLCQFLPTDNVALYDGNITTAFSYWNK